MWIFHNTNRCWNRTMMLPAKRDLFTQDTWSLFYDLCYWQSAIVYMSAFQQPLWQGPSPRNLCPKPSWPPQHLFFLCNFNSNLQLLQTQFVNDNISDVLIAQTGEAVATLTHFDSANHPISGRILSAVQDSHFTLPKPPADAVAKLSHKQQCLQRCTHITCRYSFSHTHSHTTWRAVWLHFFFLGYKLQTCFALVSLTPPCVFLKKKTKYTHTAPCNIEAIPIHSARGLL